MRDLRGSVVVVKYGGAAMGDADLSLSWAREVVRLSDAGAGVVVVHGGGPALTRTLSRMGIDSTFEDGHRVTSREAAEVAEMVLSGRINKEVVSLLCRSGGRALGLSGTDGGLIRVRRYRPGGRDLGFVGEVEDVDPEILRLLLDHRYIPVLSSTAADGEGCPYNINADLVAGAVAAALGATHLVFLSDVPGVLVEGTTARVLTDTGARELLRNRGASGGMRPKLETALQALDAGVPFVHLVDGRTRHALLRALLGRDSPGTRINRDIPRFRPQGSSQADPLGRDK